MIMVCSNHNIVLDRVVSHSFLLLWKAAWKNDNINSNNNDDNNNDNKIKFNNNVGYLMFLIL